MIQLKQTKKNAEPSVAPELGGLPVTEGTPGKLKNQTITSQ